MKDLVDAKHFLINGMSWLSCVSSKNNPEKNLFTLLKNEYTKKAWITALNQKEDTSVQSQHINSKSTLSRALF